MKIKTKFLKLKDLQPGDVFYYPSNYEKELFIVVDNKLESKTCEVLCLNYNNKNKKVWVENHCSDNEVVKAKELKVKF